MPVVKPSQIPVHSGSGYPAPFDEPCQTRHREALSDAGGLSQFGVHRITLEPGAWSSQRHWHSAEDELVYVLAGYPTLIDDSGETALSPGDVTTHPAGEANGHHMINRTDANVVFLIVGSRRPEEDTGSYPDIDLQIPANGTAERVFMRKDGSLFEDDA